jgi:hypothetical protein
MLSVLPSFVDISFVGPRTPLSSWTVILGRLATLVTLLPASLLVVTVLFRTVVAVGASPESRRKLIRGELTLEPAVGKAGDVLGLGVPSGIFGMSAADREGGGTTDTRIGGFPD